MDQQKLNEFLQAHLARLSRDLTALAGDPPYLHIDMVLAYFSGRIEGIDLAKDSEEEKLGFFLAMSAAINTYAVQEHGIQLTSQKN